MEQQINEAKIEAYRQGAAWMSFSKAREEVMEALRLLEDKVKPKGKALPFQLLAVRRYLRIGDSRLQANWSWTEGDVRRQYGLEPTRSLYAEAAKVQKKFSQANPGYQLDLTPVRSLERQVRLWMDNSTVQLAGARCACKDADESCLHSERQLIVCRGVRSRKRTKAANGSHPRRCFEKCERSGYGTYNRNADHPS